MAAKLLTSATPADLAICLALEPPTAGVQVGGGVHVVIPPDWQAQIAQGKAVPGCTYAAIAEDGSLYVSDAVQAKLADTNATKTLDATKVASLQTELATAVVVGTVAQAEELP